MLQEERFEDPGEALRLALTGWQATIWTALAGIVQTVNLAANTCTVQPAMKCVQRKPDGTLEPIQLPILLDVPIIWSGGGGYTLTVPLTQGDEGLVVFSSRCIDPWWQSGGVQTQINLRMHNLSDGFFIPGVKSQPNKLANVSSSSVQLRKNDGSSYVDLAQHQITLHADANNYVQVQDASGGGITKLRGSVHLDLNGIIIDPSGNVSSVGTLNATGEGTFNSHTVGGHTHLLTGISLGSSSKTSNTPTG